LSGLRSSRPTREMDAVSPSSTRNILGSTSQGRTEAVRAKAYARRGTQSIGLRAGRLMDRALSFTLDERSGYSTSTPDMHAGSPAPDRLTLIQPGGQTA